MIIGREENKAILAADSRVIDPTTGNYRDDDCKIVALNDKFLFSSAGIRHFDASSKITRLQIKWDSHDVAMKVFTTLKFKSAEAIAKSWGETGAHMLNKCPFQDRVALANGTGFKKQGSTLLVVGLDKNGQIDAKGENIIFDKDAFTSYPLPIPNNQIAGIGEGQEIVSEFQAGTTERARNEIKFWKLAVKGETSDEIYRSWIGQLVHWVILYDSSGMVGGEPEVVELRSGGSISWIKYGPCKKQ